MTPTLILRELRAAGVAVSTAEGRLRCVGALPAELTAYVRDAKDALLDLLHQEGETFRVILGQAGTGKTFMVRRMAEEDPGTALTATTGIAAVNLGAGTINALLGFFDTESLRDMYISGKLHTRLRRLADDHRPHIVIDEVSMMDGEQLTLLVRAIETVNLARPWKHRVRLTLCGDVCQLPPVKAPYVFESPEWPRFAAGTTVLRDIRRQSDPEFIEALGVARRGNGKEAFEFFRAFLHEAQDTQFDGATIMGRNAKVDAHNELRLAAVPGRRVTFTTLRWGRQLPEWRKEIPDILELKEGAVVMILANQRVARDSQEFLYANGDLGTLIEKTPAGDAAVKLQRTGDLVCVRSATRDHYPPSGKKLRVLEGSVTYMPLRCAYATTTHRSQGLTLDRVQIDLRDYFMSNPGSLYVALSRARTPQGLRLVGSPGEFIARCKSDSRVRRWL